VPEMSREITRYRRAIACRYDRTGGHAIHVDFLPYLREIRKERAAGARRRRDCAGYPVGRGRLRVVPALPGH